MKSHRLFTWLMYRWCSPSYCNVLFLCSHFFYKNRLLNNRSIELWKILVKKMEYYPNLGWQLLTRLDQSYRNMIRNQVLVKPKQIWINPLNKFVKLIDVWSKLFKPANPFDKFIKRIVYKLSIILENMWPGPNPTQPNPSDPLHL